MELLSMRALATACVGMAVICSAGCTHDSKASETQTLKGAGNPQAPFATGPFGQAAAPAAAPVDTAANLPKADRNVPEDKYVHLDSGYQVATLFYALSGMPPDYEALARAASQEYRSTNDEFRKRDLIEALKPQINQQIALYRDPQRRYFTATISQGLQLGHYDFKTSAFPFQQDLSQNSYHYFNDANGYTFSFTNGTGFEQVPVTDEGRAKEIESLVTHYQLGGEVGGYVCAQGADTAHNRVEMQIVRMVLYGPQHREIARN